MIELIFNDATAGMMIYAKKLKNSTPIGGASASIDKEGNITTEPWEPEPYTGPYIEGSTDDIAAIWLLADIGDISDLPNSHKDLWRKVNENYTGMEDWDIEDKWYEEAMEQAHALINRLIEAAKSGEHIRIWWSDAPGECCGFYWAMDLLENAVGPVTAVKIPPFFQKGKTCKIYRSSADIEPLDLHNFLSLERTIEFEERKTIAKEWKNLVNENAPLRAVINGQLCSVQEDFYDYVLRKVLSPCEQNIIDIIGRSLIQGPSGISDWWYAWRIKAMIEAKELEIVEKGNAFYSSTIRPTK